MAQLSRKSWNVLRYYALGQVNPDVIMSEGLVSGHPMLFYKYSIESSKYGLRRNLPQVVETLQYLSNYCKERDIRLLVVLIPDKETVYREYLPSWVTPPLNPLPSSCLWELEDDLQEVGIHVLNLTTTFRIKAKQGELLYWGDDTHWNPAGVNLAAKELAPVVKILLKRDSME